MQLTRFIAFETMNFFLFSRRDSGRIQDVLNFGISRKSFYDQSKKSAGRRARMNVQRLAYNLSQCMMNAEIKP